MLKVENFILKSEKVIFAVYSVVTIGIIFLIGGNYIRYGFEMSAALAPIIFLIKWFVLTLIWVLCLKTKDVLRLVLSSIISIIMIAMIVYYFIADSLVILK